MVGEVAMGCEGPPTSFEGALERFLAVVDAHVGLQVSLLRELLAAARVRAYEGLQSTL